MSKTLYLSLFAFALLPAVATAQIKPGPSQVVCVLDPDETPAQLAQEAAWKNPNVQGVLVRESWAALEPSENNYDFSLFDKAAQMAQQTGKFIGLQVGSGTLSPDWIYKAGARPFAVSGTSADAKMPLPWDPVFQDAWGSMIEALGARFDGNPAVSYVMMTGTGRDYDSSLASTKDEVSRFQDLGGPLFWSHASADIAELYTASFPHTHVIWSTTPVIPGSDGQKLVDSVASGAIDSGVGQFGVTTASLASESFGTLSSLASSELADHAPMGLDVGTDNDPQGVVAAAERHSVAQNATYVSVSSRSINNGALLRAVRHLPRTFGSNSFTTTSLSPAVTAAASAAKSVVTPSGSNASPTADSSSTVGSFSSTSSSVASSETSSPVSDGSSSPSDASSSSSSATPSSVTSDAATATSNTNNSPVVNTVASTVGVTETAAEEAAACAQITTITNALASGSKVIWLTSVPGGAVGAGTQASPLNVYTAARLTAALAKLSNGGPSNLVVHLLAGTYYTSGGPSGWAVSTNWQFLGAGQSQTILKYDPTALTYTNTDKRADSKVMIFSNGSGGLMENMTVDANCTGCGSALLAGFTLPAPRATVSVNVADSTPFTVGKWVYLQDSVPTGGVNLYYALMEVVSKPDATHVVLKNSAVATGGTVTGTLTAGSAVITGLSSTANLEEGQTLTGTGIPSNAQILYMGNGQVTLNANATASGHENIAYGALFTNTSSKYCPCGNSAAGTNIPATAHVLIDANLSGILAGDTNVMIENMTVQNVAMPSYEGPAGIEIDSVPNQTGVVVQDCTVQSVWGTNGWILPESQTVGLKVIGNTIRSNGYNQGIGIDAVGSIIENNTITGCYAAFFSDTQTKSNITVSGNIFEGLVPIDLAGSAFQNSTFSNNQLIVTQNGGAAIQLIWTDLTGNTFTKNKMSIAAGITGAVGVRFDECTGSSGNVFSDNTIEAGLTNYSTSTSYGTQSGNVDTNGAAISLGLAN